MATFSILMSFRYKHFANLKRSVAPIVEFFLSNGFFACLHFRLYHKGKGPTHVRKTHIVYIAYSVPYMKQEFKRGIV